LDLIGPLLNCGQECPAVMFSLERFAHLTKFGKRSGTGWALVEMGLNLILFGTAQLAGQESCQAVLTGMFGFWADFERHWITFLFQLLLCFLDENLQTLANRGNA